MRVKDFMTTDLVTVDVKTPILEALEIMKNNKVKRLPITKNGKFVGLVSRNMIRDASPSEATSLSVHELNYILFKMTVGYIMVKKPISVSPDLAVEEAICFGWIDSIVKRLDDDRYARKFTPRRADSKWSTINRRRYRSLKARGLLAEPGKQRRPTGRSGDAPRVSALPPTV